jgi:hypothetical protein
VLNTADPALNVPVPSTVAPSRNCTVPVADEGDTVAVKVTGWLATDGFSDEAIATLEAALLTVTATAADALPALLASPL